MARRRIVEEEYDDGRRRREVIDEEGYDADNEPHARAEHDAPVEGERAHEPAHEHEVAEGAEVAVDEPHPWDIARGWVRTLAIWIALALVLVETLLLFRFGFLLANANENNGFVDFIYDVSRPLVEPFEGIASQSAVNGGVFDPATLIAVIVYFVAALLLILLIMAITSGPSLGQRHVATRSREHAHDRPH